MAHDLGITDVSRTDATGGGCCGGGACACGHGEAVRSTSAAAAPDVQRFAVTGMTCGHCVASVTEELGELDGVQSVDVELVPGGASSVAVRAARPLGEDEVRAAVEEAGYSLTGA